MHASLSTGKPAGSDISRRIAKSIGLGRATLNEVDFDDLFVSEATLKALHHMAHKLIRRIAVLDDAPRIKAYWVEETLELVLCALAGKEGKDLHVVLVPEAHWSLRARTYH